MFFSTAAQITGKMEAMRKAEAGLITLARRFGEHDSSKYEMELFDTEIPVSILPFTEEIVSNSGSSWTSYLPFGFGGDSSSDNDVNKKDGEKLTMNAIRVTCSESKSNSQQQQKQQHQKYPLVILHGYMNGALYFYRNLASLASYFDTVVAVDLLGWGLSSRPSFDRLKDDSVETAEDFWVESLEYWRAKNNIEKMTLAGHSMGGYLSVAYCEKYPERVDQLLLLSPAGVPEESLDDLKVKIKGYSYTRQLVYGLFGGLWQGGYTPGSVMRRIPESRGRYLVEGYVKKRLPSIRDPEEQDVLSDYMYLGSILPGSGEYGLSRLLDPGAIAKKPCLHRVPNLDVRKVTFLYGVMDWMDVRGGVDVRSICRDSITNKNSSGNTYPEVEVYQVPDAGHLLMLENASAFNAAMVLAAGGDPRAEASDLPIVAPNDAKPFNYTNRPQQPSGGGGDDNDKDKDKDPGSINGSGDVHVTA